MKSVHTANRIRDPPRRERRQLPRMKKGLGGGGEGASKVVDCGIDGRGRGAYSLALQEILATDQSTRSTGVGQDTRGSSARWVKKCRRGERL